MTGELETQIERSVQKALEYAARSKDLNESSLALIAEAHRMVEQANAQIQRWSERRQNEDRFV